MEAQTSLQAQQEGGWVFETRLLSSRDPECRGPAQDEAFRFAFTVAPSGVVRFDNRQLQARSCCRRQPGNLLAAEMLQAARTQVPGALPGRSLLGIRRELAIHYRFYQFRILRRHATVTDIGGMEAQAPDYDGNAVCFEHPSKSLGPILRELKRRIRPR